MAETDDAPEEGRWKLTNRANVIAFLKLEIAKRDTRGSDAPINLPLHAARIILECAMAGQYIGLGKKTPPAWSDQAISNR